MLAQVKILIEGYTNADSKAESGGVEKTCPTITLVKDEGLVMVVDPGVLDSQQILIEALAKEGLSVADVNMVCVTHSHIDHYRNIGMFPEAKTLEFYGIWDKGSCEDWQEQFSPNIQILKTPGHDYTSITLFVSTEQGIIAICGDVFWREDSPENDHNAKTEKEIKELKESREMVLKTADWIIPGHGEIYKTKKDVKEEEGEPAKEKEPREIVMCRKCEKLMRSKDKCLCRPWLCFDCCECHLDCDLCGCSHKRR